MADAGYSYDTLVASLSAIGTASGAFISLSVTGKDSKVIPLVDYGDFSQHIFFTDAVKKMCTSIDIIKLNEPEDIFPSYKKALNREDGKSTILVEFGDYHNEK